MLNEPIKRALFWLKVKRLKPEKSPLLNFVLLSFRGKQSIKIINYAFPVPQGDIADYSHGIIN